LGEPTPPSGPSEMPTEPHTAGFTSASMRFPSSIRARCIS
jgi:hypothetical protein